MSRKYPVIIDIKPSYLGLFSLFAAVNEIESLYIPHPEVANLYVAMEGFSGIYADSLFRIHSDNTPTDNPIIFYVTVLVDGKFLLYTHDERMTNVGYIHNMQTTSLYTAMEGLSRRYEKVGECVFKINPTYPY